MQARARISLPLLLIAGVMGLSSGSARGVLLISEDFVSWPTDWTQEVSGVTDATIKHDAANDRMEIEHPGNFGAQVGSVHDLAHEGILTNAGDRLVYTIDFELQNLDFISLEFGLMDATENVPANNNVEKLQYGFAGGTIIQMEGGTLSDSLSAPLAAGILYRAILDVSFDGASTLTSIFTIDGGAIENEGFNSSRNVSGPLALHMHFETFTIAGGFIPVDMYVDFVSLESFSVPEPATAVSVMLGACLLGLRRRR